MRGSLALAPKPSSSQATANQQAGVEASSLKAEQLSSAALPLAARGPAAATLERSENQQQQVQPLVQREGRAREGVNYVDIQLDGAGFQPNKPRDT